MVTDIARFKGIFTVRNVYIFIMISWVLPSLLLILPLTEIWGKFGYVAILATCNLFLDHTSQSFKLFLLLVRAVIPSAMIIYFYVVLYKITVASHKKMSEILNNASTYDIHSHQQEIHLTRMVGIIFIVFVVSYFPCTITGIIDWNTVLSKNFHMFCEISVYLGSAVNPLVYGLMNSQFRHAYKKLITCKALKPDRKVENL